MCRLLVLVIRPDKNLESLLYRCVSRCSSALMFGLRRRRRAVAGALGPDYRLNERVCAQPCAAAHESAAPISQQASSPLWHRRSRANRAAVIAHDDVPSLEPGGLGRCASSVETRPTAWRRHDAKIKPLAAPPRHGVQDRWPRRKPPGAAALDGHTGVAEEQTIRRYSGGTAPVLAF